METYSFVTETSMQPNDRTLTHSTTLIDAIRLRPDSMTVMEDLGIDYACCGAMTISAAAGDVGVTPHELASMLTMRTGVGARDWNASPLSELTRFLTDDHRYILAELLPHLRDAINEAADMHGPLPLLRRMHELENTLRETISVHAGSEEDELFPIVEGLEAAAASDAPPPHLRISARVLREAIEHESLRDRLHALRDLANELLLRCEVPAINTALRALQKQLHQHMHIENNVLYPRAIAIENGLRHAGDTAVV
jgi:regulator of cell morphogenesis and NO signaling